MLPEIRRTTKATKKALPSVKVPAWAKGCQGNPEQRRQAHEYRERIVELLQARPATTKELAEMVGLSASRIGGYAITLYQAGRIHRSAANGDHGKVGTWHFGFGEDEMDDDRIDYKRTFVTTWPSDAPPMDAIDAHLHGLAK